MLVADELELGALGGIAAGELRDLLGLLPQSRPRGLQLCLGLLQDFQCHHLGMLQGAAIVAIGIQNLALPLDLVLGLLGDGKVGAPDLVEPVGDIAARDLHPHVGAALEDVDLPVGHLVHESLGVIANRVEPVGDRVVALADLHFRCLLAHDLVEDLGLAQRARDERDLVLVQVGYLLQQGIDRRGLQLRRHQPQVSQRRGGLVQILQRRFDDSLCHIILLARAG